jgi:hypothetical protein
MGQLDRSTYGRRIRMGIGRTQLHDGMVNRGIGRTLGSKSHQSWVDISYGAWGRNVGRSLKQIGAYACRQTFRMYALCRCAEVRTSFSICNK